MFTNYKVLAKAQLKLLSSEQDLVVQRLSSDQASSRIRPPPIPKAAKTLPPPPKEKGGELWEKIYQSAIKSKHPNPEFMADSALRSREMALKIEKKRRLIEKIDKDPKPPIEKSLSDNPATPAPKKGGRKIPPAALRCKATKMDGKQCEFKCKDGEFCTKHSLKN
jgi:hypothetical protein